MFLFFCGGFYMCGVWFGIVLEVILCGLFFFCSSFVFVLDFVVNLEWIWMNLILLF